MFGKSERNFLKNLRNPGLKTSVIRLARILSLGVLVTLIALGFYYTYSLATENQLFQLRGVEYQGLVHLDKETIDSMLLSTLPSNLLNVKLDQVRKLIESESRVKKVHIRRKLPGYLVVLITERQAIAVATIDNELYAVDFEGTVLGTYSPNYRWIDRPIVKGLKSIARENAREENSQKMRLYLQVLDALKTPEEDHSKSISEIDLQNPNRVSIIPQDDPVQIYLGNGKFLDRYKVFLSQKEFYQRLKEQYGLIQYIDLTYDGKIIFHAAKDQEKTITTQIGKQS